MIPDIEVKTYGDFIKKWIGHTLDGADDNGGICVEMYPSIKLRLGRNAVIQTDAFLTPKYNKGWKDLSQRREFYNDAKRVGVVPNQDTKCEWHYLPTINTEGK